MEKIIKFGDIEIQNQKCCIFLYTYIKMINKYYQKNKRQRKASQRNT